MSHEEEGKLYCKRKVHLITVRGAEDMDIWTNQRRSGEEKHQTAGSKKAGETQMYRENIASSQS